jgi:hypothetical protein
MGILDMFTGSCKKCNQRFSLFHWKHKCENCRLELCSNCITLFEYIHHPFLVDELARHPNGYFCDKCLKTMAPVYQEFESKYIQARKDAQFVETYPSTYINPPKINGSEQPVIETDFYRQREMALLCIKVSSAFLYCDLVYDLRYNSTTVEESNGYKYKKWSCSGIPAKRNKERKKRYYE